MTAFVSVDDLLLAATTATTQKQEQHQEQQKAVTGLPQKAVPRFVVRDEIAELRGKVCLSLWS